MKLGAASPPRSARRGDRGSPAPAPARRVDLAAMERIARATRRRIDGIRDKIRNELPSAVQPVSSADAYLLRKTVILESTGTFLDEDARARTPDHAAAAASSTASSTSFIEQPAREPPAYAARRAEKPEAATCLARKELRDGGRGRSGATAFGAILEQRRSARPDIADRGASSSRSCSPRSARKLDRAIRRMQRRDQPRRGSWLRCPTFVRAAEERRRPLHRRTGQGLGHAAC